MHRFKELLNELRTAKTKAQEEIGRLDNAIDAIQMINGDGIHLVQNSHKKRKFTAASRAKMAAAQKARWAKLKRAA